MIAQTKRALKDGSGRRIVCGSCDGRGTKAGVTCERCKNKGTVLYPLRRLVERLTA